MKEKNYSIQFLRFLFVLAICLGHLLWVTYCATIEGQSLLKFVCRNCFIANEFFFIVSGYFLYFSAKPVEAFVKERLIRLWPMLAFSIGACGLLRTFHISGQSLNFSDLATLFLLQGTGVSQTPGVNGPAWFICVLFWCSIIFYIMLRIIKRKTTKIITLLLIFIPSFWGFIMNLSVDSRGFVCTFISILMLKGLSLVALGIMLGAANEYLNKSNISKFLNYDKINSTLKVLYSIIEFTLAFVIIRYLFFYTKLPHCNELDVVLVIVAFVMMFLMFSNKAGVLSAKILNHKFMDFLGSKAYAIFIMQNFVFLLINNDKLQQLLKPIETRPLYIILWLAVFILVGLVSYYLVEKPVILIYKKLNKEKE